MTNVVTLRPRMGVIYLLTNVINGRMYVGKTAGSLKHRWNCHVYDARRGGRYALHRAMRKYGVDAFWMHVLEVCDSDDALNEAEIRWIAKLGTFGNGYNMTSGGEGTPGVYHSPESIERSAAASRGRKLSDSHKAALLAARLGKKNTAEHIEKVAAATRGLKRSRQTRDLLAATHLGMSLDEYQARRAAGERNCKGYGNGTAHWAAEAAFPNGETVRVCRECASKIYRARVYGSPDAPLVRAPRFRKPRAA